MSRGTIKIWYLIHKWSGLIPTVFLLMLCVTGLPLIFHDEIDIAMGADSANALTGEPSAEGGLPLDRMLAAALAERPGEVPLFMAFSPDSPLLTVTTGPTPDAAGEDMSLLFLDRASGASLGPAPGNPLMDFLLQLHTDMFLGLPGMWVLGAMGLLFVVALISGTVLYAPFMRRIAFGTVRTERSPRVKRLDQHNLIGIVALAWMAVIGLTGAINAFADPLTDSWRDGEVAAIMGPNGSGKSTLAYSIAGHPKYTITGGTVTLDGEDVLAMSVDERARAGLFLAMQYPVEVPGVSVANFLRTAKTAIDGEAPKLRTWVKDVNAALEHLNLDSTFSARSVNEGFSGGEKKRHEIAQLELLDPKVAILDETDSGLDIDALKVVSEGVNRFREREGKGVLLITHYTRILRYIQPDKVHVFVDGKVAESGGPELADKLEAEGYDKYLSAAR